MPAVGSGKEYITMAESRKRASPSSPPPWQRPSKDHRRSQLQDRPKRMNGGQEMDAGFGTRKEQESFVREQTRLNQIQEAEQMREWVSKEDDFVLQQSKKKAHIRVKEGRAKAIDWLAVTLGVIDPTKDPLEDNEDEADIDVVNPSGIFEGLTLPQLQELGQEIDLYNDLESNSSNRRYWTALKVICKDHQDRLAPAANHSHSNSVSADIDCLLGPKSLKELEALEKQISGKLRSNEPIDVEYWEQLLRNVAVYKSRAELSAVYRSIIANRLNDSRQEQRAEASNVKEKLSLLLNAADESTRALPRTVDYTRQLDPEPLLKLRSQDKALDVTAERAFLDQNAQEKQRVTKMKYVPLRQAQSDRRAPASTFKAAEAPVSGASRFASVSNDDFSSATKALYDREVARGVQEDEEIFAGEEEVSSISKPQWAGKHRPRKPRYFNRVQLGYEWNKYNQTHYDHENPPPKVVQGYKFNIFYPDLIDKVKAPTYRIEREHGRKRGESFAPAGEEDTCLIRFISGPPYEDLAFRIVDKEWDYSAKKERGFRSSFDKGILQLHFQFKKVYYRK